VIALAARPHDSIQQGRILMHESVPPPDRICRSTILYFAVRRTLSGTAYGIVMVHTSVPFCGNPQRVVLRRSSSGQLQGRSTEMVLIAVTVMSLIFLFSPLLPSTVVPAEVEAK